MSTNYLIFLFPGNGANFPVLECWLDSDSLLTPYFERNKYHFALADPTLAACPRLTSPVTTMLISGTSYDAMERAHCFFGIFPPKLITTA